MGKNYNSWKDCAICSKQRKRCKSTNSQSQHWFAYIHEKKHGSLPACPHTMRKRISMNKKNGWNILRSKLNLGNIISFWYAIVLNRKCIIIQRQWRNLAYRVPDGGMFCFDCKNFKNDFGNNID